MKMGHRGKIVTALTEGLARLGSPPIGLSLSSRAGYTALWGRDCGTTASVYCVPDRGSSERGPLAHKKMTREKIWREFFSDPSQWWDHRSEKVNPRYPDFKHKKTQQALWVIDNLTPAWVEAELATVAPGLLQSHIFSWHLRLRRHVKFGEYKKTLDLFQQMQREGMMLDKFTFVAVLTACSNLRSLEEGRLVHEQIIERGCESDVYVANSLVDMYAKCGRIDDAWSVFKNMQEHDVVSWSAIIGGYVKSGHGLKAMELFSEMEQEGVEPDGVIFVGVLNACASVAALEEGRRVHEQIIRRGCEFDKYVATCLVDMYAKCGSVKDAWDVFHKMPEHDLFVWNAMIGAYVQSEQGLKAMQLFSKMQQEGIEPNAVTFVGVLNACASLAALEEGKRVHEQVIQRGCMSNVFIATCLVDMYAKCGSIEDAWRVFNKMRERNVVSWSAMIGGFAMHGHAKKAVELFKQMCRENVEINEITFISVLSACRHAGLVKEGLRYFNSMISCYNVLPTMEHYACIVDLLGRAGRLDEAEQITARVPVEGDATVWRSLLIWRSLLGGCGIHGNIEMAERAAKRCWELDPGSASCHLLLSKLYAVAEERDSTWEGKGH